MLLQTGKISVCSAVISAFLLGSCSQEVGNTEPTSIPLSTIAIHQETKVAKSPVPIVETIQYTEASPEETEVAEHLQQTAEAFKEVFVQPEVSQALTQDAKKAEHFELKLSDVSHEIPELAPIFENLDSKLLQEFSFEGITYYPVLYVPNAKNADFTLPPVVLIGTEAEVDVQDCEDCIPGWAYDKEGNEIAVLVDEEMAKNSKNPMFILTNGTDYVSEVPTEEIIQNDEEEIPTSVNPNGRVEGLYPIFSFQINHRYERTGKSEYYYVTSVWGLAGGESDTKKIAKVSKKDIGVVNYSNNYLTTDVSGQHYALTFEYDWYAGRKKVTLTNINGAAGSSGHPEFKVRMKFSNEWYQGFVMALSRRFNGKGFIEIE